MGVTVVKKIVSAFCIIALLACTVPVFAAADALEDQLLGSVSAQYESNGDPGSISGGNGDLGGASYGAYQFAGTYDVPLTFAKWCVSSGNNKTVGNALVSAYEKDGNTFGQTFKAQWIAIADEDAEGFLRLQRLYVKEQYYQPAVKALATYFQLDIADYGIAFKNAVWSRTLQHGLGSYTNVNGFLGIMKRVVEGLPAGLAACSEEELITAVYEESGKVVDTGTNAMTAATAGGNAWIITKYQLEGKYMKYFSGNSAAVQAGVYLRLRVNELRSLLEMLATYGGYRGNGNGLAVPRFENGRLILSDCDTVVGFYGGPQTALSVTEAEQKQGTGALVLLPMENSTLLSVVLQSDMQVCVAKGASLVCSLYLPVAQPTASLTVQLLSGGSAVWENTRSAASLTNGWNDLTLSVDKAVQADGLSLVLSGLSPDIAGKRFLLDDLGITDYEEKPAYVLADALNCRSGPDTEHSSYGLFGHGVQVAVLGGVNGWLFCSGTDTAGKPMVGWCSSSYLRSVSQEGLAGDVDGNGRVDAGDALLVLKFAVDKYELTAPQQLLADMNWDEVLDASDALMILKVAVGKLK